MSKAQYNAKDIALTLSDLRSKIRNGQITLYFRNLPGRPAQTAGDVLRKAVSASFGIDKDAFNTENFNTQTLKRFATLFDVPSWSVTSPDQASAFRYPSQDDVAWALQNFINRRANPWSHVPSNEPVLATEVSPINV